MSRVFFAVSLLIFLARPCYALPQEMTHDWLSLLSNQPIRYSHWIDLDGYQTFRQYADPSKANYDLAEYFLHTVVVSELDLSSNKRKKLESAFEDWSASNNNNKTQPQKATDLRRRKKQRGQSETQSEQEIDLVNRINRLLTDQQKQRVRQLHLRFLIHQNGFYQTLCNKTVAEELTISIDNREHLIDAQQAIALEITQESRALAKNAFAEWISELPENHQKVIEDRWGKMLLTSHALQQLILQLNSSLEKTEFTPEYKFDLTQNWPQFKHDIAGRCVVQKKSELGRKHTAVGKFNWLHSMVFSKHFQQDIEIVDAQITEFKELSKEWQVAKWQLNSKIGKRFGVEPRVLGLPSTNGTPEAKIVYTLQTQEQMDAFEKEAAPIARELYSAYLDVFLPHQHELIERVVANINTRLQGPLADLLWGDLGNALKLSKDEKERLKIKADKVRLQLEVESKKLYDDSINQLIELADRENRQKIRKLLGEPCRSFAPNLDGFAAAQLSVAGKE